MVWQLSWVLMTLFFFHITNTFMLPWSNSSPMPWPWELEDQALQIENANITYGIQGCNV
jgi:hypothetical protein